MGLSSKSPEGRAWRARRKNPAAQQPGRDAPSSERAKGHARRARPSHTSTAEERLSPGSPHQRRLERRTPVPRRKTDLLERLHVPKPCYADWDSMSGDDRVRFCEHCRLSVNDLSRLTMKEAERLVAGSGGRLCVRYVQLPGGSVLSADAAPALYHIARRASRLAA